MSTTGTHTAVLRSALLRLLLGDRSLAAKHAGTASPGTNLLQILPAGSTPRTLGQWTPQVKSNSHRLVDAAAHLAVAVLLLLWLRLTVESPNHRTLIIESNARPNHPHPNFLV